MVRIARSLKRYMVICVTAYVIAPLVDGAELPSVVSLAPSGPGIVFTFGDERLEESPDNPYSISAAGDVDGDGFGDFVCLARVQPLDEEVVFVVYGRPSPPRALRLGGINPDLSHVTVIRSSLGVALLGWSSAAAGDVDGDGFDDVFISESIAQRVHLLFGSPTMRGREVFLPSSTRSFTWTGVEGRNKTIAAIGDLNSDGMPEFAFGTPYANERTGRVYIASWRPEFADGGEVDVETLGVSAPGLILDGVLGQDYEIGWSVAAAGDVNGDGVQDLCVGSLAEYVDIVFGGSDLPERVQLDQLGGRRVRLFRSSSSGIVIGPGDVDGDGFDDVAIGSGEYMYILWGRSRFPSGLDLTEALDSDVLAVRNADSENCLGSICYGPDNIPRNLDRLGDVDSDGYPDLLIGGPRATRLGRLKSGTAHVVYGGPELRGPPRERRLPLLEAASDLRVSAMIGPYSGDELGEPVAGIGDFDGDGSPDIAVGATSDSNLHQPRMYVVLTRESAKEFTFLRGDCNADGVLDVSDPVANLGFQFLGTFQPSCRDALDFDDNGDIDISDPIGNLTHQFVGGGSPPAPPGDVCGVDPTEDDLNCLSFPLCRDEAGIR